MRRFILALAVSGVASAWAGADPQANLCAAPDYLTHVDGKLSRVKSAIGKEKRLKVLVLGTGSSALAGSEGPHNAYPARLQASLTTRLPNVTITVQTDVKSRRTAAEMAAEASKLTLDAKPDLVVWQTGTVDAMRGIDPDEFRSTLEKGVAAVRAAGADVVLVNMQYSPRTETMIAAQAYVDAMHWVAQQQDLPLFDRLAVMKYWSENGAFDLSGRDRSRLAEQVHDCLGKLLAELIVDAAQLKQSQLKDTR